MANAGGCHRVVPQIDEGDRKDEGEPEDETGWSETLLSMLPRVFTSSLENSRSPSTPPMHMMRESGSEQQLLFETDFEKRLRIIGLWEIAIRTQVSMQQARRHRAS
ncbi:hypothetical protein DFH09DRAFT_1093120 [Mycena vulgaris]|nr:hypothetical protein DFH09DRAFT_1093120 [Mycena vulgaris]